MAPTFTWEPWETPRYRTEPKYGFGTIRDALNAIPDRVVSPVKVDRDAVAR